MRTFVDIQYLQIVIVFFFLISSILIFFLHLSQLAFEAHAVKLSPPTMIKVRNVGFFYCNTGYLPHFPTGKSIMYVHLCNIVNLPTLVHKICACLFIHRPGLSCNFEDDLCGWYQDNSDNFDWTLLNGMDHTIGIGGFT